MENSGLSPNFHGSPIAWLMVSAALLGAASAVDDFVKIQNKLLEPLGKRQHGRTIKRSSDGVPQYSGEPELLPEYKGRGLK